MSPLALQQENLHSRIIGPPNDPGTKYASKKAIAQGMFDVALLSSNTNQLVHLLERISDENAKVSPFHVTAIVLLIVSIILQVIVGGCLLVIATTNKLVPENKATIRRINNVSILIIFFITVINVLIPSFTPSYNFIEKPSS